jgi:hypothetical protein
VRWLLQNLSALDKCAGGKRSAESENVSRRGSLTIVSVIAWSTSTIIARMTSEEARLVIVDGIDYAADKEADSSLHDSDRNRLLGSEDYKSGREVLKPSPWAEGDFEGKMAMLLRWAYALNRSDTAFVQAVSLLEDEDSVVGRVIRCTKLNDLPSLEPQQKELPRCVQVPAGLVLGLFTLLCGFASLSLLLAPSKQSAFLGVAVGIVLLLGCLWVLEKCLRLLTGRKHKGGLLAPRTLRIVSFFFLVMPVAGLFTGYYRTMGLLAIFQALSYFLAFFGLRALAQNREAKETQIGQNQVIYHETAGEGLDEGTDSYSRQPTNRPDILFKTGRFNLSKVGEHFINPCCFGEDLAMWLLAKLGGRNIEARPPYQEDWGWELPAKQGSESYYLCMSGNSNNGPTKNDGEWRIIVEKRRSIWQRVSGAGKIAADDAMVRLIEEILSGESTIRDVHREE